MYEIHTKSTLLNHLPYDQHKNVWTCTWSLGNVGLITAQEKIQRVQNLVIVVYNNLGRLDQTTVDHFPTKSCCCGQRGVQYCCWPQWRQQRKMMSKQVGTWHTVAVWFLFQSQMLCLGISTQLLFQCYYEPPLWAGCSTAVNDLVYVVDGSWSVGFTDFKQAKQWLINITSQFDISSHHTQVI